MEVKVRPATPPREQLLPHTIPDEHSLQSESTDEISPQERRILTPLQPLPPPKPYSSTPPASKASKLPSINTISIEQNPPGVIADTTPAPYDLYVASTFLFCCWLWGFWFMMVLYLLSFFF